MLSYGLLLVVNPIALHVAITGASSGLGYQLALEIASRFNHEATLTLVARRQDCLRTLANHCAKEHRANARTIKADLSDAEDVDNLADRLAELPEPIDALVCAAGVGQRSLAAHTSYDAHDLIMRTNFDGHVRLTQRVLPAMLERGAGTIVAVSSVQGFFGQPGRSSYAASKAALVGYYDSLRAEVAADGLTVIVVAPGYIATAHAASAVGGDGASDASSESTGMDPSELARVIADAMVRGGPPQLVCSQPSGRAAMFLRSVAPGLFFRLMASRATS